GTANPQVTTALVKLATTTDHPEVQIQAAQVLASAGTANPQVTTALVKLATTTDHPEVRVQAAQVLAQAEPVTPQLVTALIHVARHSDDRMVRVSAVHTLRWAEPTPKLRDDLISFFSDSDTGVRRTAGETLVAMAHDHPNAAPGIRASLVAACTSPQFA